MFFYKLLRRPNPKQRATRRIKRIKMKQTTFINDKHFFFIDFVQHLFTSGLYLKMIK